MATSGTTDFNPALGGLAAYALGRVKVRRTAILQEHLTDAYIAANLVLQDWSNDQPNLWDLELLQFSIVQGQQVITLPSNVVMVTDAYVQKPVGNGVINNRIIFPVGRSEWASYPNPLQQAQPTTYWFNRVLPPTLNLYPVPDQNGPYTLFVYALTQSEDALVTGGTQLAIPVRWMMAFADALAVELSYTYAPDMTAGLTTKAAGSYQRARIQEREVVDIYIAPGLSFYYQR